MIAWVNGVWGEGDRARIPALDAGFLLGDGLFETIGVWGGGPFRTDRHLARLGAGLEAARIPLPVSRDRLHRLVAEVVRRNRLREGLVRVTVSRGASPWAPRLRPTLVLAARRRPPPLDSIAGGGIPVRLVEARRFPGLQERGLKSLSFQGRLLARMEARRRGGEEALLVAPGGRLVEGAMSNLFLLTRGGLKTPPLGEGLIHGVVREALIEAARGVGIGCVEGPLSLREARRSGRLVLTSAGLGVVPARLPGVPWKGERDPDFRRIEGAWRALLERETRGGR